MDELHLGRCYALIELAILVDKDRRRGCRFYEEVVHQTKLCYISRLSQEKASTESSVL